MKTSNYGSAASGFLRKRAAHILFFILFASGINAAFGQELSATLETFNRERISINKTGMMMLSGWAAANIMGSSYGYFRTGSSVKYFHQMNVAWNVINLGIGAYAYTAMAGQNPAAFSFAESLSEARSLEKILLLNIGLDAGYMALGGYLRERGLRKNNERLQGYGPSLLVQGGFLLLLDVALYTFNRTNNKQLFDILERINITGAHLSVNLPF
jgi:hypothetical protein